MGPPQWLGGKEFAFNAGDVDSIPGLGRSLGEGNGNPLEYSCLENPMDGGAWWATVHGVAKSRTRLSDLTYEQIYAKKFDNLEKNRQLSRNIQSTKTESRRNTWASLVAQR